VIHDADALTVARAKRWWVGRAQITTPAKAAAFVDDVGFALLFPRRNTEMPCLWDLARDDPPHADGWGPDIQRVWKWKDDLPKAKKAWYGDFLFGVKTFIAPSMLALLYPRGGAPDDFLTADLSPAAQAVATVLLESGATPSSVLREAAGMGGTEGKARYSRALTELGRALVVTHYGVEEEKAGWPSAVLELTARVFAVQSDVAPDERRHQAVLRFLTTMVEAHPRELSRAWGWPLAEARAALSQLVEKGQAVETDGLVAPLTKGRR